MEPLDPHLQQLVAKVTKQATTERGLKLKEKDRQQRRLSGPEIDQLVVMSANHTAAQLSDIFRISPAAVTGLLQRRNLEPVRADRLTPQAKRLIVTSDAPVPDLAAAFGVSMAHIYALRREYKASLPGATPSSDLVGRKVTRDMLATILDPNLSPFNASRAAGVGIATVYNYRRDHKAKTVGVEDLV